MVGIAKPKITPVKWAQQLQTQVQNALSGANNLAAIANTGSTQSDASDSKLALSAQLQALTGLSTDQIESQLQRMRETAVLNEALQDITTDTGAATQQVKVGNAVAKLADDARNDTTETKLTMMGNSAKAASKAKDVF